MILDLELDEKKYESRISVKSLEIGDRGPPDKGKK
jgi:hypothetical protein